MQGDISQDKRSARNNEIMLRISMALPEYPDLEELLDYISNEVKELLDSERALVLLLDEEREELFFPGTAYDDTATRKRVKEIRFPIDELIAGKVVKTGEPIIVSDTSKEPDLNLKRYSQLGNQTKNLLLVPLKSSDRTIGVLCAIDRKQGRFDQADSELLSMIAGIVALSIENARFSEEIKKAYRKNEALPEYPDLEKLLDYISSDVKGLLGTEGGGVMLLDEEREELFFLGVSYDDTDIQKKVKEIRFPIDDLMAGKVIKTGEPIIVSDTSMEPDLQERDKILGYHTRNLLLVPLKSSDRIIGVLCAINKKEGDFDQTDVLLMSMIGGTAALSIENARFSEVLKKAYKEVTGLNRAKDNIINLLSHELKTPVSVIAGSLKTLERRLKSDPEKTWKPALNRINRNLDRIMDIQKEMEDIMQGRQYKTYDLLSPILDQCVDELEALIAEEVGETQIIDNLRKRIEEILGHKEIISKGILPDGYVKKRLEELKPFFSHRQVEILSHLEPTPPICIPAEPLQKVIDGLVKNAIENTPDEGKIEVIVQKDGEGTRMVVHDYGVGINEEDQRRIFEGFFTTQDKMKYSSKRPFDFNAGGKGADLLRMKIFSERYNFRIDIESSRCPYIPKESGVCPGRISNCAHSIDKEDCFHSGGTIFSLYFPPVIERVRS